MRSLTMVISLVSLLLGSHAQGKVLPEVVESLDIQRYMGRWYEIASTKPSFQENCVCVTADYSLQKDGKVSVTNSCRKGSPEGELDIAEGVASPTDNPAKLNVSFGRLKLPFSNYWVVDLGADYSYAVVSTAFRNPVWILSRTPQMDSELYQEILAELKARKFDIDAISPTLQEGCDY